MTECRISDPGHPWVTCERTVERHDGFGHYGYDATVDHYRSWVSTPPLPPVVVPQPAGQDENPNGELT